MAFQPDPTNPITTPLEKISYGAPYSIAIIAFTLWLDVCTSVFVGVPLVDFTFEDFSTLAVGKSIIYIAGFSLFMQAVRIMHLMVLQQLGEGIYKGIARSLEYTTEFFMKWLGLSGGGEYKDDFESTKRKEIIETNRYRDATRGYVLEHKLRTYAISKDNQTLYKIYENYRAAIQAKSNALSAAFSVAILVFSYQFLPTSSAHDIL